MVAEVDNGGEMPVWPSGEAIIQSLNARSHVYGRLGDDPLPGVVITDEMRKRAWASQAAKASA